MLHMLLELVPVVAASQLMGMVRQLRFTRLEPPPRHGAGNTDHTGIDLTMRIVEAALARCEHVGVPVLGFGVELDPEQQRRMRESFAAHKVTSLVSPTPTARPESCFATDPRWDVSGHCWAAEWIARAPGTGPSAARMQAAC